MSQQIVSVQEDPAAMEKVQRGLALPAEFDPQATSLKDALEQSREFWQNPEDGAMPQGFVEALNRSLAELVSEGLESQAVDVGQPFPSFSLLNQNGKITDSQTQLANGPLVVTFYRGQWCPYCNLALRALQSKLPELRAAGANLVAVSPQQPDGSLSTAEMNELEFDVVSDNGLRLAREAGVVWKIPDYALDWHEQYFGLHLETHNGDGNRDELPVPATFVLDRDGVVRWRFVEADYWKRAEPDDVLQAVRSLS